MKKLLSLTLTLALLLSTFAYLIPVGADTYDSSKVFVDVPADAWFKSAVDFVASRGIMGGAGQANTFKPSDLSTRSMLAVILHRLEGEPAASTKSPFVDLSQDWYRAAADWAYESGVVKGSSATTFNPDGKVTRQELVTMLYRYADYCGMDVSDKSSVDSFPDSGDVASWALDSVEWALGAGLINGRVDGGVTVLAPMGNTQRCEMATILSRFITKLEGEVKAVDPMYERIESLGACSLCSDHKAALHVQLGPVGTVTEAQLGAVILSYLGLDTSIYSLTLKDGVIEDFSQKYSKVKNGEGTLVSVSFTVTNNRTLGEDTKLDSLSIWVVRNDWYAVPRIVDCSYDKITDEEIAAEISEFDSLYVCEEHGCVHFEAEAITEDSFKEAVIGLMSRNASAYKVIINGDGFTALKTAFDKLSVGKSASAEVKFAISNEYFKKQMGYESVTDSITVKFSAMKAEETICRAVECPYESARKATDGFIKKYVCNEHGKAHVTLKSGTKATLAQMTSLVTEALDLGGLFTVKLDTSAFNSGKVKVKLTHVKGYEMDGPEFTPVYETDSAQSKAVKFTLCENERDAYKLIVHDNYAGNTGYGAWANGQPESGWIIDNRADDAVRHGAVNDTSAFNSSQVIREINNTSKGVINHRCAITINSGFDGAVLGFRNADGDSVVRLQTIDGVWKMLKSDGTYETVFTPTGDMRFVFNFKIDLYENTVRLVINDKVCGTYPLATNGVNSNIQNFRFSSTDEGKIYFTLGLCEANVNYSLYEIFTRDNHYSALPAEWEHSGASIIPNTGVTGDSQTFDEYLSIQKNGYVKKTFDKTSGKVILQFAILPAVSGSNTEYVVSGGGSELIEVKTDDKSFYVNGKKAYDYVKNVWYYLYLVCDTETGKVQLKINGIDRGEFTLAKKNTAFDTVKVTNSGEAVTYDEFFVYNKVTHSDYVPEPVKPAGEENYTVGINVCSLWQNGFHGGWACITPYDDVRPVLGYYDEGSPETADWEIKYMVEHGVDFQAFCFYTCQETGAITTGNGMHLEDGFKYAEYSDMMKYCLTWETQNATKPRDMDAWVNYFVPYLIEHHFKDPRYMTIDNKLLFPSFGSYMTGEFWNVDTRKEALSYLEEQVKKLGFDGVIYVDVNWCRDEYSVETGIDGIFSYNHGQSGASFEGNKTEILTMLDGCSYLGLYYVPTVSTGFNCVGWMNERTPLISTDEFAEANEWVKNEYFKTTEAPAWAENLVWISTWNEYGEGTYIMPAEGLNGFGYLDVLREAYTSEKADLALNTVPTAAQLERINRLYPQHMKLLRAEELEPYTNGTYEAKPQYEVREDTMAKLDFSSDIITISDNLTLSGDNVTNNATKSGKILFNLEKGIDLSACDRIEIKMSLPNGKGTPVGYGNGDLKSFDSIISQVVIGTGDTEIYEIKVGEKEIGSALQITLPAGATLYNVRILGSVKDFFAYTLTIDGVTLTQKVLPELSPRGEYLTGFDALLTDRHPYGIFTEWDAQEKVMTVSTARDVYEFTVGSSFYKINGVRYFLGYKLYEKDGVPMIPLNVITERLGLEIDSSDLRHTVVK